ncbi:hypothetical protein [Corynebacterium sp.]|uniref:hypothetical protein n=1 Tax=Corynebacterium sp. TaxID=1720 RepID=UPI0025BE0574|nr:hypothetical protein [Corynebacterium sp.]
MTSHTVRAVQFLDAFFQCTRLTPVEVLTAGQRCIARRTLRQIVALTDPGYGAQSPMETVLRLVVRDVLPTGYRWQSPLQISMMDGAALPEDYRGRCATPDLACPELKVALFYDGQHHDGADQTDIDVDMFQELRDADWEVIRINRVQLKNRTKTMKQIAGGWPVG